ncbi:hypothetical protein CTI12_AA339660 [Artemisia annua]|uniref:NAD-dependent epimerase/dehydratase domain-containing protein n=1 Tax=Artemisia annua TaxID=35608 RepID=A0A2U1MV93_ARTAN|nr:hypothetical protein CTI12_AA339660 [Artemisia annua]
MAQWFQIYGGESVMLKVPGSNPGFRYHVSPYLHLNFGVRLVFSSSATVYGQPKKITRVEDFERKAMNPYGHAKVVSWKLIPFTSDVTATMDTC